MRLRFRCVAELDALGDEVFHDDDTLLLLLVVFGEIAGRVWQRDIGVDIAIPAHFTLVHLVVPATVCLEPAFHDDEFGNAGGDRRVVPVEPQPDLAAGGKDRVDDLA